MDAYERALEEAGGYGRFQIRYSIVYNYILVACSAMVYMNIVMVLTVPPHYCRLPPMPNNVSEQYWKEIHLPKVRDPKGNLAYSSCQIYVAKDVNQTKECAEGYEYDQTWYHSTAASENDWVCERELLVADAFAYSRIGEVVGSLMSGWLGDKYGRKVPYVICLALAVSGRALTAFSSGSFVLFVSGSIIAALSSVGAGQSAMIISMETTSMAERAKVIMVQNLGWATGVTMLPFFYWWLEDWFPFMIITTLFLVPFFMLSWQLIESPRWLWTMGRKKESLKQLRYIAKENGNRIKHQVEKDLLESSPPSSTEAVKLGPFSLFSNPTLAMNTIMILTMWFCSLCCYAFVTMSSGENHDEGNPFLRFAWQGLAEIPGFLLGIYLANKLGRRFTSCVCFAISAILQLITLVTMNSNLHYACWSIGVMILNKSCITAAYYVTTVTATEIYPTCLRQNGLSLGTLCTGIAFASTPYIVYLGRRVNAKMPSLILTTLCIIGGIAGTFLPETLNVALPETLQEAQRFGADRSKNYFKLPTKMRNTKMRTTSKPDLVDFSQQVLTK